jgi:ABC-2 type transport system ATP-binding protein
VTLIEVRGVTQQFGDVLALDNLDLRLEGQKIIGLLGRNGSGKTTLLSILAGFRKQTSGEVLINGQPVFENPAVVRDIALIREAGDTVEESEKVKEALRFAEYLRPNWDMDYARAILERYEVAEKSRLDQLSRGKRSAVGIALGLASRAPLTMFDETYLGLDAPSRYVFYDEILRDYMEHPRTFILSTHLIEEVSRIFEDVVIIDRGKVLVHDDSASLQARGMAITGPQDQVDAFIGGRTVIGERQLGRTKSAMLFGHLTADDRERARDLGLDLEPLDLQDLFVYMTEKKEVGR